MHKGYMETNSGSSNTIREFAAFPLLVATYPYPVYPPSSTPWPATFIFDWCPLNIYLGHHFSSIFFNVTEHFRPLFFSVFK